jgi:hypothetical protein
MDEERVVCSLVDALATVPDPRSRHGRRHPLPAVFRQFVAAMLSGAQSLYAVWQWGRLLDVETVHALGFTREKTPSVSTLFEIASALDVEEVEKALCRWGQENLGEGAEAIALDGKAPRGTWGKETPGLILVSAYATHAGQVLAQKGGTA